MCSVLRTEPFYGCNTAWVARDDRIGAIHSLRMTRSERWLTILLRLGGVLTGAAVFAVFLPTETMAAIHRGLGLGELPAAPITEYLTRSLSAMYALHGVVLLALSVEVRRHLRVVRWMGWATALLGALLLFIDLRAPLPGWWVAAEGPWVIMAGILLVWLSHRTAAESEARVMTGIPLKSTDQNEA